MTDNKTHPFAVFMAWASQSHTIETVANWLDGKAENADLAKFYQLFSQGKTQDIISALNPTTTPTTENIMSQVSEPVNLPRDSIVKTIQTPQPQPKSPITPLAPTQPSKPESMHILDNIQPADQTHKDDWFPYKGIMTITTSDPQNTQFLTAEIRDAMNQLVEIAQIDPEFDKAHQIIHLKIQTSFEDLEGETLKRIVAWSDGSGEEYSETNTFVCV